jgi:hypothetical protein
MADMEHMTDTGRDPRGEPVGLRGQTHGEPTHVPGDDSAGDLVAGMAKDAKHLGEQYLNLARIEVAQTVRTSTQALVKVLVGSGLLVVGVLFLGVAIGLAVAEWTELPDWASFGLLALAVLGAAAASLATIRLKPKDDDARSAEGRT